MNIHIETERFILRDLEEDDVQGIFELDSDPEVHKFLGNAPISKMKEAENIIKSVKLQYIKNGIGRWAIIDKASNEFVGWTGLKYEEKVRKEFNYYDIGYRLKRKFWGKGIATETALLSLKYGFEKLELTEICGAASVDHAVSNKILSKIGLHFEHTFTFENELVNWYTLKKSDWIIKNQ